MEIDREGEFMDEIERRLGAGGRAGARTQPPPRNRERSGWPEKMEGEDGP